MIDHLLEAFRNLLFAWCLVAALRWIIHGFPPAVPPRARWAPTVALGAGWVVALLLEASWIRSREVWNSLVAAASLTAEALLLLRLGGSVWGRKVPDRPPSRLPAVLLVLVGVYRVPGFLLSGAKAMGASQTALSSDVLVVVLSLTAGLGIAALGLAGLSRLGGQTTHRLVRRLGAGLLLLAMADQVLSLLQVWAAGGAFARLPWAMKSMILAINNKDVLLFASLALLLVLPGLRLLRPSPMAGPPGPPGPQTRLAKALRRRQLRWAATAAAAALLGGLFIGFSRNLAEAPPVLSDAVPVAAPNGRVEVGLEELADDNLHRYVYTASDGTGVRFIAIRKGGAAYGVGLDACQVCGPTGYFQRQGQVVCRLCDVQMNKASIGFPGGCNPVPLAHDIEAGKLIIPASALEASARRFR